MWIDQTELMQPAFLVLAGIGAGLTGSIAGLASLVSYPTLLASGLSPVTANVTNTVALVCSSAGSVSGSRIELAGQGRRVRRLAVASALGGALGGALLLVSPAGSFERIVPFLIALASVAILARRRLVVDAERAASSTRDGRATTVGSFVIGIYGGYFGAGAGVMMLALLLWATADSLPRSNAVKNVVLGVANGVAAVAFVVAGDVRWRLVVPLGAGLFLGGRIGPMIVRRVDPGWLRTLIAVAGLGLAVRLGVNTYR